MNQPKLQQLSDLEVYLEGVPVPFLAINLGEAVDSVPVCDIQFAGNINLSLLLPNTKIMVFGKLTDAVSFEQKSIVLFEGFLTATSYNKTANQHVVSISATNSVGSFTRTFVRPQDALLTKSREFSEGVTKVNVSIKNNTNNGGPDIVGPNTTEYIKKILLPEKKKQTNISGDLDVVAQVNLLAGLADEFTRLTATGKPGAYGDYLDIFRTFISYFEQNDLYFGIDSLSMKYAASILAFPNETGVNSLKTKAAREGFDEMLRTIDPLNTSAEGSYNLYKVFVQMMSFIKYKMLMPLNMPAVTPFFLDSNKKQTPIRVLFMPTGEFGPPISCNIFFPEQVSSFSYSRDLMSEPTRLISQTFYDMPGATNHNLFMPLYVMPDLELTNPTENNKPVDTKFTFEETYRGVNFKITQIDGIFAKLLQQENAKKEAKDADKKTDKTVDTYRKLLNKELREFAVESFSNLKYAYRTAQIVTEWSPYRLVGFPALFIEPGKPSVYGTISAIQTQISAGGVALSTITLSNARLIYDEEITSVDQDNYLKDYLPDLITLETAPALNESLYDRDLWSFTNISEDVYTYILSGKAHSAQRFKNKPNIFKAYKAQLTESALPVSDIIDNSVLKFIKKRINGKVEIDLSLFNKDWQEYLQSDNIPTEYKNNLYLVQSIKELKKFYNVLVESNTYSVGQTNTSLHTYISELNYRSIVTKADYLAFLQLDLNAPPEKICKNLYGIINDKKISHIASLKDYLTKGGIFKNTILGKDTELIAPETYDIKVKISELKTQLVKIDTQDGFKKYIFSNLNKIIADYGGTGANVAKDENSLISFKGFMAQFLNIVGKDFNNNMAIYSFLRSYGIYPKAFSSVDTLLQEYNKDNFLPFAIQARQEEIVNNTQTIIKILNKINPRKVIQDEINSLEAKLRKGETVIKKSSDSMDSYEALFRIFNITRYAAAYHATKVFRRANILTNENTRQIMVVD